MQTIRFEQPFVRYFAETWLIHKFWGIAPVSWVMHCFVTDHNRFEVYSNCVFIPGLGHMIIMQCKDCTETFAFDVVREDDNEYEYVDIPEDLF